MSDEESRSGSLGLMLAIVLVAVIAGVGVVMLGGRDEVPSRSVDDSASQQAEAASPPEPQEGPTTGSAEPFDPPLPTGMQGTREVEVVSDEVSAASLQTPTGEIPPEILEDFRRGMVDPTEEERAALAPGMDTIPAPIREVFEEAARRPIPQHILDDFENPYPEGRFRTGAESGEAETGGSRGAEAP
jgi:hypothetical protein